jgi:N6-L-threonylcarbamoyladenine synthase
MKILAIETSCDETAAAIVSKTPKENSVKVLSNIVASSLILHSKTGGVIPNIAAREQLKAIIPVVQQALIESNLYPPSSKINLLPSTIYRPDIDAIAVTQGPGLIGSLLIGVETAKTLAYLWNKPIIPVNHLFGHIYANFIGEKSKIGFPALALLVSGGHTDLVLMKNHKNFKWLGGTRDDAAGEAFDKIGRLLNLPYPAGPVIEIIARDANEKAFNFPRPMIGSKDFNFSFSGLKAAVMREVIKLKKGVAKEEGHPDNAQRREHWREGLLLTGPQLKEEVTANIAASVQKSIIEVLVRKTLKAAKKYNVKSILLSGGVAANQKLSDTFKLEIARLSKLEERSGKNLKLPASQRGEEIEIFAPQKSLCTDNAAMIGAYAAFHPKTVYWKKLTANPELYFD